MLLASFAAVQDSKPWRLQMPCKVHYFDVDQPGVIQAKQQGLQEAGAATMPAQQQQQQQQEQHSHLGARQQDSSAGASDKAAAQFPLLVGSWQPVPGDLSQVSLSSCLEGCGFDRSLPTVWLAEALLYYLTLDQVGR
jgi:O-methyltransferase involved in polyketide biosynthesis